MQKSIHGLLWISTGTDGGRLFSLQAISEGVLPLQLALTVEVGEDDRPISKLLLHGLNRPFLRNLSGQLAGFLPELLDLVAEELRSLTIGWI